MVVVHNDLPESIKKHQENKSRKMVVNKSLQKYFPHDDFIVI